MCLSSRLSSTLWKGTRGRDKSQTLQHLNPVPPIEWGRGLSYQPLTRIPSFAQHLDGSLQKPERATRLHIARTCLHDASQREKQRMRKKVSESPLLKFIDNFVSIERRLECFEERSYEFVLLLQGEAADANL